MGNTYVNTATNTKIVLPGFNLITLTLLALLLHITKHINIAQKLLALTLKSCIIITIT